MGLSLAQIINKFVPIQFLGSSVYQSYPLSATTTVQTINFGSLMNSIMVTNDGTDDVKLSLQGNSPIATIHDNLDPAWTYTGTWSSDTGVGLHSYGTDSTKTNTVGSKAVYNPNKACNQITVSFLKGSVTGNAQLELSSDGGVTWQNPSTIQGITRNDGVTGSSLDAYNTNQSGTAVVSDLTYTLPTFAKWAIRVTCSTNYIYIDAGKVYSATALIVKPGETQSFTIQSSSAQYISNSGTQPIRMVVTP